MEINIIQVGNFKGYSSSY